MYNEQIEIVTETIRTYDFISRILINNVDKQIELITATNYEKQVSENEWVNIPEKSKINQTFVIDNNLKIDPETGKLGDTGLGIYDYLYEQNRAIITLAEGFVQAK